MQLERWRGWGRGRRRRVIDLGQAFDLETLGHLEEGAEVLLVDRDLPAVHELKKGLHLVVSNIPQEDDRVSVRGVVQERLKVGRAGGQNHLVGLQLKAVAGQGHVHEGLRVQEVLEHGQEVVLVVVPAKTVLLGGGGKAATAAATAARAGGGTGGWGPGAVGQHTRRTGN